MLQNQQLIREGYKMYHSVPAEELIEQFGEARYEGLRDLDALHRFFMLADPEETKKDFKEVSKITR